MTLLLANLASYQCLVTCELEPNLCVPRGCHRSVLISCWLPSVPVASQVETLVRGVHVEEKAGTFPHRPHSHLPYFQLPWHYSSGLTNIKHQGCNSGLYVNSNTTLHTKGNIQGDDKCSKHFITNCTLLIVG